MTSLRLLSILLDWHRVYDCAMTVDLDGPGRNNCKFYERASFNQAMGM